MLKKLPVTFFIIMSISIGFLSFSKYENNNILQKKVDFLNEQIREEGFNWQAGITTMSLLDPAARLQRLGGLIPAAGLYPENPEEFAPLSVPDYLDWRDRQGKNWLTAVKSQGSCGSCYIFGVVAVIESIYKIESNKPDMEPDFSEQYLLSCSGAGNCSDGGSSNLVLEYIKYNGFSTETCYPYEARDTPCNPCDNWQRGKIEIQDFGLITHFDEDRPAIFNALQKGPVVGWMKVYDDFYHYISGIYKKVASAKYEGGHIFAIVGYDNTEKYWICKNSWGKGWGEQGYFRIAFGEVGIGMWINRVWGVTYSNHTPVFAPLPDQSVKEGDSLSFKVSANDIDNDPITYSSANLPSGAEIDPVSGIFDWTPDYSQAGIYMVTFTASDDNSNTHLNLQITVINVKKGKKKF